MAASSPMVDDASGSVRRASGRVRKAPEAYTSSPYTSNNKRKRSNEEDGDVQMPEDYVSDEDVPSEDDEPDEEEVREQNRRARKSKPAAPKKQPSSKKPKTDTQSKALAIRPAAAGKKRKAPKRANGVNAAEAEEAGGLYAAVFATGDDLDVIAAAWLQRFEAHESRALAELVNFVLRSAGCESEVTEYDIEDPDGASSRLTDIQDEFQATNPTEYPLIKKGRAGTDFRDSMSNFLSILIKSLHAKGVLIDNKLVVDNIEVWLSTLSSAANRAFRHTATVASLAVMTALCEIAAENANEASAAQRQSEGERKKTKSNKARVSQIEQKVKDAKTAQGFLEELLSDWFDAVFVHRYRDVDPVLRRECASALGDWISIFPSMFFDGAHLRYLGWVLSDEVAATRAEIVKQLQRLYKKKDNIAGLKTFTEKFRPRMVEIAISDAESSVRASGIELLDTLREDGLLEPDDVDAVGRLIYDFDPRVRKAVAPFFAATVKDVFNSKVDELGGIDSLEESLPEVSEGSYDSPAIGWLMFKALAEMLVAYNSDEPLPDQVVRNRGDGKLVLNAASLESRFTRAAGSLYDTIEEMQDWQGLASYLLFDHSSGRANGVARDAIAQLKHECVLDDKEEFVLLEVVSSSVKHLLVSVAEKSNSNKLTKKQKDELKDEQEEIARHLATLIPNLLKKFGGVPRTAAAVLRMESVLNLPSLEDLHQDSVTYGALLDDIRKQFMSHGADEVLVSASNAIQHAKSYVELDDLTEEKLTGLWEDVVNNLAELLDPNTITVRGASNEEELVALSNNLLRITRLSLVSNPVSSLEDSRVASKNDATGADYQGAIDYVIALIQRALPSSGPELEPELAALEDEVAARAAEAALRYLQWKVNAIFETVQSGSAAEISYEKLEALATRRDTFVDNLHSALDSRKAGDAVCAILARYTLQLHTSTAVLRNLKAKPGMRDDWAVLVMDLPPAYLKSVMKVFGAVEQNFAKLSNKKLEKRVSEDDDDDDVEADPMDEDPISESESDEEDVDDEQRYLRDTKKQQKALLAEQTLIELTAALVFAVHADVVEKEPTRKRLERNKARLGANYKESCGYLDLDVKKGGKSKAKAKSKPAVNGVSKSKPNPKSNAIVAEDEVDDDIEDADAEDEEALRRRGLVVDDEQEEQEEDDAAGAEREAESVVGD